MAHEKRREFGLEKLCKYSGRFLGDRFFNAFDYNKSNK